MVSDNALDSLNSEAPFAVLDISSICGHIDLVRSCWCHIQQQLLVVRARHSVTPLILVLEEQRQAAMISKLASAT